MNDEFLLIHGPNREFSFPSEDVTGFTEQCPVGVFRLQTGEAVELPDLLSVGLDSSVPAPSEGPPCSVLLSGNRLLVVQYLGPREGIGVEPGADRQMVAFNLDVGVVDWVRDISQGERVFQQAEFLLIAGGEDCVPCRLDPATGETMWSNTRTQAVELGTDLGLLDGSLAGTLLNASLGAIFSARAPETDQVSFVATPSGISMEDGAPFTVGTGNVLLGGTSGACARNLGVPLTYLALPTLEPVQGLETGETIGSDAVESRETDPGPGLPLATFPDGEVLGFVARPSGCLGLFGDVVLRRNSYQVAGAETTPVPGFELLGASGGLVWARATSDGRFVRYDPQTQETEWESEPTAFSLNTTDDSWFDGLAADGARLAMVSTTGRVYLVVAGE